MRPATVVALVAALLAGGCRAPADRSGRAHLVERARVAMGSELRLAAWTADEPAAAAAFTAVFEVFDRLGGVVTGRPGNRAILAVEAAAGGPSAAPKPFLFRILRK